MGAADIGEIALGDQCDVVIVVRRKGEDFPGFHIPQQSEVFGVPVHVVADRVRPQKQQILLGDLRGYAVQHMEAVFVILIVVHECAYRFKVDRRAVCEIL